MWTVLSIILVVYVVWAVIDLLWGDNSYWNANDYGGDK